MPTVLNLDQSLLQQWLAEKLDIAPVRQKLMVQGLDEESVTAYVREYRKNSMKRSSSLDLPAVEQAHLSGSSPVC
jgi:hypothetical protein